jgi:hypothetical protein
MTLGMETPDFFGAPQYFVNRIVKCESAGNGNARLYFCSIRGGELVPEFSVVMSLKELMTTNAFIKHMAADLWNSEQLLPEVAH